MCHFLNQARNSLGPKKEKLKFGLAVAFVSKNIYEIDKDLFKRKIFLLRLGTFLKNIYSNKINLHSKLCKLVGLCQLIKG